MPGRKALFLLPRQLNSFILADFVRPLAEAPDVLVHEPGRVPAGTLMRLPAPLAAIEARREARGIDFGGGEPAAFVLMHPVQWPLASALLDRYPQAQLWYGIWDRYESAPDADEKTRARVGALHEAAADRADWRFAVSSALADIEAERGRQTDVLPPPHDSFPDPDPAEAIVAASLGHLGRRTDWGLLAALLAELPQLSLLLIGEVHGDETPDDPGLPAVLAAPNAVRLGSLDDEAAARVISLSDVCLLPFRIDEFNDMGLPQRILKAAKLGRRTLVPDLKGPLTQAEAVTVCTDLDSWIRELQSAKRDGRGGDRELRSWALAQNETALLAPFRARLESVGVGSRP